MDPPRQQFANYDSKMISMFEVLGSHFVDIYFNHVWASARARPQKSITDEYERQVQAFIIGVKTDKASYREVVAALHQYFRAMTRYSTMSFAGFVDQIVAQVIPADYLELLRAAEKDEALGSIVVDLVSSLGAYVTTPEMLRRIIDEHDVQPAVTIRMIQDQSVTILLAKRGEIHNKFLRRVGQAKETVPIDVVEGLKKAVRQLVREKAVLSAQLVEARDTLARGEEAARRAVQALADARKREARCMKLVRMLRAEKAQGLQGAAFAARGPRPDTLAEHDPLAFEPRVVPAETIAERGAADEVSNASDGDSNASDGDSDAADEDSDVADEDSDTTDEDSDVADEDNDAADEDSDVADEDSIVKPAPQPGQFSRFYSAPTAASPDRPKGASFFIDD
jgi:hypothetical protein